jgi:uncharacterized membrane protein
LIPSIAPSVKLQWKSLLGKNGYKASFAVLIVISIVLISLGWRSTQPDYLYTLPPVATHIAMSLLVIAFILMGASNYPTRIKRYVRHPQLSGLMVWGIAHLILNGDNRSVVLFTTLAIWALLEMIFISKREGLWQKPQAPSIGQEIKGIVISLIVIVVVVMVHPYIAGVAIR